MRTGWRASTDLIEKRGPAHDLFPNKMSPAGKKIAGKYITSRMADILSYP